MLRALLRSENVLRLFYGFGYLRVTSSYHMVPIGEGGHAREGFGILAFMPPAVWSVITPQYTSLALAVATVTLLVFPNNWRARFLWWISVLILVHFYFMTGHTNYHSFHLMMYVSFIFIFWSAERASRRSQVLHACIAIVGTTYFSSGCWKAYEVAKLIYDGDGDKFYLIARNSVAYATAEGSQVSPTCSSFLLSSTLSSSATWFFTIAIELSGIVVAIFPQFVLLWIPLLLLLHTIIGNCLGIWFVPAMGTMIALWSLWVLENYFATKHSSNISLKPAK